MHAPDVTLTLYHHNGDSSSLTLPYDYKCPVSNTALGRAFEQLDGKSRLPVLLAVIHHENSSTAADGKATWASYSSKSTKGMNIDFYEENYPKEPRVFTHICNATKQKHLPAMQTYVALFDPQQEALRVRHCLRLLTHKEQHEPWLSLCLQQPISQATYPELLLLASHLIYGYGDLQANLPKAIALLNELIAFRPEQSPPQLLWLVATIKSGWDKTEIAKNAPSNMPESKIDYMLRELRGQG